MNIPNLLEELKCGLDDLRLIDPNHLYADLLEDSIEAIETLRRSIHGLLDESESFRRKYNRQIKVHDVEIKELTGRYQAELERLNELLAARTREETVLLHGRKYRAAELLDIVKAGEDRAKELVGLYDCVAAKLAEAERKIAALGASEEACKDLASQRDEAIAKLSETERQLEAWERALEIERDARLESIMEVHRLKFQLRQKSEIDAFLGALQSRPFFAMPGRDP